MDVAFHATDNVNWGKVLRHGDELAVLRWKNKALIWGRWFLVAAKK